MVLHISFFKIDPMTGENEEEVEEERDYSTAIILPEEKQYYPDAEEV